MSRFMTSAIVIAAMGMGGATSAYAQDAEGDFTITPFADVRARYEHVDQPAKDANAVTLRLRAGAEVKKGAFSILAEGEGTMALSDGFNAFPFHVADEQRRPEHSVIADPNNLELNRLQAAWSQDGHTVTVGRQRINLDDQRWVGAVAWRQNEQTFDAVRGEFGIGEATLDLTYSNGQRTLFGDDAEARTEFEGDFLFGGIGGDIGRFKAKAFTYLLDYDEAFMLANSSQTYGVLLDGAVTLDETTDLKLKASFARQADYGDNPVDYAASYWNVEAGTGYSIFNARVGIEQLGSDEGAPVRTPMATLHKFNGWADMFLATPAYGLNDKYAVVGIDLGSVVKTMKAQLVYHEFESAVGDMDYGEEWDASLGFNLGKVGLIAKYARYRADTYAVDTEKVWFQAQYKF